MHFASEIETGSTLLSLTHATSRDSDEAKLHFESSSYQRSKGLKRGLCI